MDQQIAVYLSIAAFVIGVLSWAIPSAKYWSQTRVGGFAIALLLSGIVLMTTFKWTDIALEISGARLKISQLEDRLQLTRLAVVTSRPDRAQVASLVSEALKSRGVPVDDQEANAIAMEVATSYLRISEQKILNASNQLDQALQKLREAREPRT